MYENLSCDATVIGANIEAQRRALKISRQKLSSILGYQDRGRFVERVESGGQSIPAEYLPEIAKALQVEDIREFYVKDRIVRLRLDLL
jgi:transcriptional regulator with XRE-family HTH domain